MAAATRRGFLTLFGCASVATTATVVATLHHNPGAALSARVNEIMQRFRQVKLDLVELVDRHDEITRSLPKWVRPGHEWMDGDGVRFGEIVSWPEVEDLPPPAPRNIGVRVVRPSLAEVWRIHTMVIGGKGMSFIDDDGVCRFIPPSAGDLAHRRRLRVKGFAAVRKAIARMRHAREIERASGIIEVEDAMDERHGRLAEIRDELASVTDRSGNADLIAARLLVAHFRRRAWIEPFLPPAKGDQIVLMIGSVYDRTTGLVRETCGKLLAEGGR